MNTRRITIRLGWALTLALALTLPAVAQPPQEQPLSITGNWYAGYSGVSNGGSMLQGPYLGFDAVARGFWKDPRILTYYVQPSFSRGFAWESSIPGPDGLGISAGTTFLAGSKAPVTVYYSRFFLPSVRIDTLDPQAIGFDTTRKQFGIDWTGNFKNMPTFNISYRKGSDLSELDGGAAGSESKNRDLNASTQYMTKGWSLSGNYSNTHSESGIEGLLTTSGAFSGAVADSQSVGGTALRSLPFDSRLMLEGGWSNSDSKFSGSEVHNTYNHATANIDSRPMDRLTTNVHVAYVSNIADFLRQQLLQSGVPSGTNTVAELLATNTGTLSYGGSSSFRVGGGVNVVANYGGTEPIVSEGIVSTLGAGRSLGVGINFMHSIQGGEFYSSYQHSVSSTDGIIQMDSTSNFANFGYSHALPFGMSANGGADYSTTNFQYGYIDSTRLWGVHLDVRRKVGTDWTLVTGVTMRKGTHDYPAQQENGSKSFKLSLSNKKLQLSASENFTYGLAYQFGSRLIFVPGTTETGDIPGLPSLVESSSRSFSVTGNYRATRRLSLQGSYYSGLSTADDSPDNLMKGYDFRMKYRYRQVWLASGYRRDIREFSGASASAYRGQSFYVMVRREFNLF